GCLSGLSDTLPLILRLFKCTELFQKSNISPISERKLSYDNLFNYKALYQKDWLYLWTSNLYIYTGSLLLIVLFCIWYERELKNVDFKQKEKKILNALEKRLHQPGAIDELRHKSLSNEIVDFLVIINNKVSNEWIDKVMS
ncbi:MAG: hypothetical protein V7L13_23035, partial [Nostoc sp.]|uniref:hypothetical protein n=1 Tax=Nostoc sp. TaxID=1180 RepID=UPI002FF477FF